jgi:HSP20 family protein
MNIKSLFAFQKEKPFHKHPPYGWLALNLFSQFFKQPTGTALKTNAQEPYSHPQLDLTESKDSIFISVELPGVDENDISVSFSNGFLTIQGVKKAGPAIQDATYQITERSFGKFLRSIAFPYDIDSEHIKATFSKGLLKIKLPKLTSFYRKEKNSLHHA